MTQFTSLVIGDGPLLIQCAQSLLSRGNTIVCVVTGNSGISDWAKSKGLRVEAAGKGLVDRLNGVSVDWVLSISNLSVIGEDVLAKAENGGVNFHDGPLPKYAGLNAPLWALLNRETQHGVSWHLMDGGVDEGDVLEQRLFDLTSDDTALSVNTKCYGAAIESFDAVLDQLESGVLKRVKQDLGLRNYCGGADRPVAAARIDFARDAMDIVALVRALDHGGYENPLAMAKIDVGGRIAVVGSAECVDGSGAIGEVLSFTADDIIVATGKGAVRLGDLRDMEGKSANLDVAIGEVFPSLNATDADELSEKIATSAKSENQVRRALKAWVELDMPLVFSSIEEANFAKKKYGFTVGQAVIAGFIARQSGVMIADIAIDMRGHGAEGYLSDWAPVRFSADGKFATAASAFEAAVVVVKKRGPFAVDLQLRTPDISDITPVVGMTDGNGAMAGTALTFDAMNGTLYWDENRIDEKSIELILARLEYFTEATREDSDFADLPVLPESERQLVVSEWNATDVAYDRACVHGQFEAQVARTPDAEAVVFEGESLSYAALNAKANQVAYVLRDMGVGPDALVGLYMDRSIDLLIGALAIQKAGGAYVPLDPAYPVDRIAHYISDSRADVIVTQSAQAVELPKHNAKVLEIDRDDRIAKADKSNVDSGANGDNLAYMIYTSGSTGVPKGVMVEHRNVANFFAGMDARIDRDDNSVWLALTSLSFDISVLELFYTLTRGYKLVISGDESRTMVSSGAMVSTDRHLDFSLFYWGNDDGPGPRKYKLLLDGARFADTHGFSAVWTPERHFHAFGGPYPNPSVTGAAVAAVTNNIAVRSGSCVAPLHHPARIAEEWAVIDNLTNGRAGLGIASGWQPDDFVLRPENTPPNNKPAMYETIEILRKLWRGEAVEFVKGDGTMHSVVTQPRPVSKELPIWITTAGNPQTWVEAGELGANVLTHLLGQSVAEVGGKIKLYRQALRDNGHNPDDFTVTLMLHTYVAEDRETARDLARRPMKDYLRSAAGLIKQSAWDFPAFKRPKGVKNSFELNLDAVSNEDLEAILDFAFERYFEDSGMFGTIEDCLGRCEQLKRIGVDEIGCLIDYGIDPDVVIEGLKPLAEVLERTNQTIKIDPEDFSIAAQIVRHKVTHLQCTPSMARMLTMNEESSAALHRVKHLLVGGEALPGSLVHDLEQLTDAQIENMYGPTETTIWSSTEAATVSDGLVNIGRPIANTCMYVLDDNGAVVPVGVPGELFIGGDGVTRGYWQRDEMTAERFVDDPFHGGRMYRTGDLVRWRSDGKIDFLGRLDSQVKLRGYRIEVGEIEARLEGIDGVAQAAVILREDTPGDMRLVAYVTGNGASDSVMRRLLAEDLPEYMIPAHFVMMDVLPLTPNKKIDRQALPIPQRKETNTLVDSAPISGHEARIAEIWKRILGVGNIGPRDSFFDLGGHSLLAVQAHREIREAFGVKKLSITDIFRFPILADLTGRIENLLGTVVSSAEVDVDKQQEKVQARSDAMSKRRAMRASRQSRVS